MEEDSIIGGLGFVGLGCQKSGVVAGNHHYLHGKGGVDNTCQWRDGPMPRIPGLPGVILNIHVLIGHARLLTEIGKTLGMQY